MANPSTTLDVLDNFFTINEEHGVFTDFCRMSRVDFDFLLGKIEPLITKQTRLRIPIPAKIRLALTLRYLANGDSYRTLKNEFKVSIPAISLIIPEVCKAINMVLRNELKLPQTPDEWLAIEERFRGKFPRCVGALCGKRIVVKCPSHSGSNYDHKKHKDSILLIALLDSNHNFVYADICEKGGLNDDYFSNSQLWDHIENDTLNLPEDTPLPGREMDVPYVFISDGAFGLHKHIMKPFPGFHDIGTTEQKFNDKLANANSIVDNAFGVLSNIFKIFKKPIELNKEKVPHIVRTCILLHNFLRKSNESHHIYTPEGSFDFFLDGQYVEGSWRQNVMDASTAIRKIKHVGNRVPSNVKNIRSEFANYFDSLEH